jgi:hypothetical protein
MNNLKLLPKILQFITLSFFSVWLGGYIARQIVIYPLFEPIELNLRSTFNSTNLPAVISTIIPLIIFNIISYSLFLITFILFLVFSKMNLKINGWLFITSLLIFVTAPFEIYLLTIDFKIVSNGLSNNINSTYLIDLIKERLTIFSSFALIEVFSYVAIIYMVVFKPLQKKNEN